MTMFIVMLLIHLTAKTYLSSQLLVYLPMHVPVHDPTCSFSVHVHICTCSSVYLFSFFFLFRHNMHNDLSTLLLGYLHTNPPENTFPLFTIMLLFRLSIKTYLSPQPLVYLPIDVPVHDPTFSFSLSF